MQWAELVIIGGAAAGALLISTPKSTLVKMVRYVLGSIKASLVSRESLQELLQLLYEIFQTARVKGLLTLKQHVEKPEESEVFSKYPLILKNHHTLEYLADSLKLMVVGGVPSLELESLLGTLEALKKRITEIIAQLPELSRLKNQVALKITDEGLHIELLDQELPIF